METIRIGDTHYNAETLTDHAKALISDIQKVEGELGRLNLQTSIANYAKSALLERLVGETANLEKVEVSAEAPAAE